MLGHNVEIKMMRHNVPEQASASARSFACVNTLFHCAESALPDILNMLNNAFLIVNCKLNISSNGGLSYQVDDISARNKSGTIPYRDETIDDVIFDIYQGKYVSSDETRLLNEDQIIVVSKCITGIRTKIVGHHLQSKAGEIFSVQVYD